MILQKPHNETITSGHIISNLFYYKWVQTIQKVSPSWQITWTRHISSIRSAKCKQHVTEHKINRQCPLPSWRWFQRCSLGGDTKNEASSVSATFSRGRNIAGVTPAVGTGRMDGRTVNGGACVWSGQLDGTRACWQRDTATHLQVAVHYAITMALLNTFEDLLNAVTEISNVSVAPVLATSLGTWETFQGQTPREPAQTPVTKSHRSMLHVS